mmetsp:Transcript_133032/g.244667  ORF Transcript_133032/g.244667 Transcript_133032/m.244667 type:complete len:124 (+) Transcript_133032:110-481(+)
MGSTLEENKVFLNAVSHDRFLDPGFNLAGAYGFGDRPGAVSKTAPPGFSAQKSAVEARKQAISDKAGVGAGGPQFEVGMPLELQPHSYDKIEFNKYSQDAGPFFGYAWMEKETKSEKKGKSKK